MTDPASVSTQLYHVAFQNTITKAMVFIDRQLQGWNPTTKGTNQHGNNNIHLEQPLPPQSTHPATTGTPSLASDSYTSSIYTNQHYDNDNDDTYSVSSGSSDSSIQTPCTLSPPPYFTTPINQRQVRRPRPMSMPILLPQQQMTAPPPPLYGNMVEEDDPYTRATQKWQNRRSIAILPREEEGKEDLPAYHCSVYKMAKVNMKMEQCVAGKKTRSWRRVYIELWGTVLRIYPLTWFWSTKGKEPKCTLSLAGADASRAIDYMKRPFVLRLTTGYDGMQYLFQTSNLDEMISWIEHLQAGINISLDLEERPMPKFLTLQPRRGTDTGVLYGRMLEIERRREQRRRNQQEILA
ncbi:hypothetical protein BC941DRAFT_408032 [Chlamydoabsidia padenii]|nr:hypothetical protein BC941DRAFT_408032 [Chlamydoabsidia padenii]